MLRDRIRLSQAPTQLNELPIGRRRSMSLSERQLWGGMMAFRTPMFRVGFDMTRLSFIPLADLKGYRTIEETIQVYQNYQVAPSLLRLPQDPAPAIPEPPRPPIRWDMLQVSFLNSKTNNYNSNSTSRH